MNSLPFGQLKSFLKILIGVQYEKVRMTVRQNNTPPECITPGAVLFIRLSSIP